jgi:DMSO/TMAO reductase YedYZ molybdopterin-dependent catalytic subunit
VPDSIFQRLVHKRLGRRGLLAGALSRGSLALLTGCNLEDDDATDRALLAVSRFNDRVQAALFRQDRLAPTYAPRDIADPFPFNAFYEEAKAPEIDGGTWKLELAGRIENRTAWSLDSLNRLPQTTQITRHVCIEGWSAIGQWSGVPLSLFLQRIGADTRASYIALRCADGYSSSLDMATALHPQTQITLRFGDDVLPRRYGFPIKIRVPTKLGFKNPKHVVALEVTDRDPGGFWENYGYNRFSGL